MTADYRRVEQFSPQATAIAHRWIRRRLIRVRVVEALSLLFVPVLTLVASLRWHEDALSAFLVGIRAAVIPFTLYLCVDQQLSDCLRLLRGQTWSDVLHCRTASRRRSTWRSRLSPGWTLVPQGPLDPLGFSPLWPTRWETLVADTEVEVLIGGRLGRTVIVVDHAHAVAVNGTLDQPLHPIKVFMPDGTVRASRSAGSSAAGTA